MKQIIILVTTVALTCCQSTQQEEKTMIVPDPHSYARPNEAVVTHLNWIANVDFEKKQIAATAEWSINVKQGASEIVFDTKDLTISSVRVDGQESAYRYGETDDILGSALVVPITGKTKLVAIKYETSQEAEALQWLTPQQTAGKELPFLFTQSQAILARSWIPTQDSPGIRFTYDATVTVPNSLIALMSASNPKEKSVTGEYNFKMAQPIPSYLLAFAAGDLKFQSISDRSGVYAEPATMESAAYELVDVEKMIAGAEELYGPYEWERYDLLILPPSFPFGGMENPRLTFATPTILAGDRSLVSLVAHELAHSWSGNLVTNATWNDFWLNEGFTVYFENRIMEKLYGRDYSEMLASLAMQDLVSEIEDLQKDGKNEDTKLKLDLAGRSADDGVTNVAYDKGYFFLRTLEEKYGRERFDAFLKDYFATNKFSVMTTEEFVEFIKTYYKQKFDVAIEENLFNAWIYSTGLPQDHPLPMSSRFKKVDELISSWISEKPLDQSQSSDWSTHEWLHFLKNLPKELTEKQMLALDSFGHFTHTGNAEILAAWGVIAYHNNYQVAYPNIENFLINTGRRKFLSPLYTELASTPGGKELAKAIYEKARPNYHFVATSTFDKLLND